MDTAASTLVRDSQAMSLRYCVTKQLMVDSIEVWYTHSPRTALVVAQYRRQAVRGAACVAVGFLALVTWVVWRVDGHMTGLIIGIIAGAAAGGAFLWHGWCDSSPSALAEKKRRSLAPPRDDLAGFVGEFTVTLTPARLMVASQSMDVSFAWSATEVTVTPSWILLAFGENQAMSVPAAACASPEEFAEFGRCAAAYYEAGKAATPTQSGAV